MRVDSVWRSPHEENTLEKSGGITPDDRVQVTPVGASHSLDGGSAALAFVFTYSNHQVIGERAARLQNTLINTDPSCEDDDPLIKAARAALLSTHRTHVRDSPSEWKYTRQAAKIAAAISNR